MQEHSRWHTLENAEQVAKVVCQRILNAAQKAIQTHGQFKLVLAGGSTPEKIYRLLATSQADWQHWYIYHGDERCLPQNHPDRNSVMATQAFLQSVSIPETQIFNIPAELTPEQAAQHYHDVVANALPFDLVLLGMGEDGHTASLFPGHLHNEEDLTHAVHNSPKPPPQRVSLSAKALSQTHELIFIVTGSNKQDAVKQWRSGECLPVATIQSLGTIDIYLDQLANPTEA